MSDDKYVIDVTRNKEENVALQHHKKVEDRYEIHTIETGPVVYHKWESPNKFISDTIRPIENVWLEEFTDIPENVKSFDPVVFAKNGDEVEPLDLNHGCILQFEGRFSRKVAIVEGEILSEQQARMREEATEKELPRFNEWEFRLKKVIVTDGPIEREHAADTQDKKRRREEARMYEAQQKFYSQLLEKFGAGSEAPTSTEAQPTSPKDVFSNINSVTQGMSATEKRNLLNLIASELEEGVDEEVDEDPQAAWDAAEAVEAAEAEASEPEPEVALPKTAAKAAQRKAKKTSRKK